jgi:hypothetical protein
MNNMLLALEAITQPALQILCGIKVFSVLSCVYIGAWASNRAALMYAGIPKIVFHSR